MLKSKIVSVILLVAVLTGGCTPLFIKENEPVILNESSKIGDAELSVQDESTLNVTIENINSNLSQGILWDISKDGNTLLISDYVDSMFQNSNEPRSTRYMNMGLFDFATEQLNPLLLSNKDQIAGSLDSLNGGYLYLENMETDSDLESRYRLLWSDMAGSTTRSISASDESVSEGYAIVDEDLLVYGNQRGEISLVDPQAILDDPETGRRTYQLSQRLVIDQIDLWEEENMAVFTARESESETYNLYLVSLTKQNPEPIKIQENISHFELSRDEGKILYSVRGGEREMERLVLYDLRDSSTQVIKNGYLGLFAFSPWDGIIVYSEHTDSSSNSQNLWIMETGSKEAIQVASNLNIYGNKIIFHPSKLTVYFTVFQINNASEKNQRIDFSVYSIDYSVF